MRALTHLNAAGVLALCGWLAVSAAGGANEVASREPVAISVNGCDCRLIEVEPGIRQGLVALAPTPESARK